MHRSERAFDIVDCFINATSLLRGGIIGVAYKLFLTEDRRVEHTAAAKGVPG